MICLTKVFFMFLHFEFCWISYICEFIFLSLLEITFLSLLYFITFANYFLQFFFSFLFLCNLLIIFFEDSKYTYINLLEVISSFIGILWISLKCISSVSLLSVYIAVFSCLPGLFKIFFLSMSYLPVLYFCVFSSHTL